jgi:hypothetical protein
LMCGAARVAKRHNWGRNACTNFTSVDGGELRPEAEN